MSAESSAPPRILFWWLATLLAAAVLSLLCAHGPDWLRRPVLTPLLLGLAVGMVSRQVTAADSRPRHRAAWLVPAVVASGAVLGMHLAFLQRLQAAAAERTRTDPRRPRRSN